MSYSIPDGSALNGPSLKMKASGGGTSTFNPYSLQATDLSFYLPGTLGQSGDAMVGDGLGQFSFVDLIDSKVNDAAIATDAVASNGNVTMGVVAGARQKLFGNGNYTVKTNDYPLLTYDYAAQQFSFGDTTYYTKNDTYTVQDQTILGASAAANAWRITDSTKSNDYLNLNVTTGSVGFTLGTATNPVKTTNYGDLLTLSGANAKPPRIGIGAGTEVVRVGGNLKSLPTVPGNIVINNGAESTLISEAVAANFLDEAGVQIRIRYGFRDAVTNNNCQFKVRVKWGSSVLLDCAPLTATANGFSQGEATVFIQTNGANPTRNVTTYCNALRVTNQTIPACARNFVGAQDFTTAQSISLVVVGTANSGDAIELEHASIDVVFPETTSP